jgi:tetratricopeptide (TPR) repeat protein
MVRATGGEGALRFFLTWLLALPLLAAELSIKWVGFPLTRQLKGTQFSPLGYSPQGQHLSLLSYGIMAAVLTILAALALPFRKYRLLCWLGAGLIWLVALAVLQVGYTDGLLLNELSSEWDQQRSIAKFSDKALPENLDDEPSQEYPVPLYNLSDRLESAFYFVRLGAWFALVAGLAALGFGLHGEKRATMGWITAAGILALICLCMARPAWGEVLIARGQIAEARGERDRAIYYYRAAMRADKWNALNPSLYERIGAVDASLGRVGSIEYGMYHAEMASTRVDTSKSVAELVALIPRTSEPLTSVVRKRAAELLAQDAQAQHRRAAYGTVIAECEKALQLNPRSLIAAYYLSRDYYLLGVNQQAIDTTQAILKRVDDPVVRANLFSNLGDAYTKNNAFAEAKLAYRQSYTLDYIINLRALSALAGP